MRQPEEANDILNGINLPRDEVLGAQDRLGKEDILRPDDLPGRDDVLGGPGQPEKHDVLRDRREQP